MPRRSAPKRISLEKPPSRSWAGSPGWPARLAKVFLGPGVGVARGGVAFFDGVAGGVFGGSGSCSGTKSPSSAEQGTFPRRKLGVVEFVERLAAGPLGVWAGRGGRRAGSTTSLRCQPPFAPHVELMLTSPPQLRGVLFCLPLPRPLVLRGFGGFGADRGGCFAVSSWLGAVAGALLLMWRR